MGPLTLRRGARPQDNARGDAQPEHLAAPPHQKRARVNSLKTKQKRRTRAPCRGQPGLAQEPPSQRSLCAVAKVVRPGTSASSSASQGPTHNFFYCAELLDY